MTVTPTAAEFRRVYTAMYCTITLAEALKAIERVVHRSDHTSLAEQRAYEHAATAQCRFCLDLPVRNAARWTHEADAFAPCPRCGKSFHNGRDQREAVDPSPYAQSNRNANAHNPRRLAVEQASRDKRRDIERDVLTTYRALVRRINLASNAVIEASTDKPSVYQLALVRQTEAEGALERFLAERGVK